MGSKISPILANLFMCDFEENIKYNTLFPRIWWRYVDDVFVITKSRFINKTVEWRNGHHASSRFTHEIEENGSLPFLDLRIIKNDDNTIKLTIYRKPTNKGQYIMVDSFHHGAYKSAAFNSMIHKALNIPMKLEDLKK